jgi:uncharacterized protein YciI
MYFVVHCIDKAGQSQARADNLAAHVGYLLANRHRIALAGPLLSDDGQNVIGNLIVIDAADRVGVENFLADDPLGRAGLFESVSVTPFRKVYPKSE